MKSFLMKFFVVISAILLLLTFDYYREDASRLLRKLLNRFQPCERPITYSIENIDPRFGLTKEELLNDIKQAEKIWEAPINKQLFEYSPAGDLKIDFVYDYRQKATDELRKIGIVMNNDRFTYDVLKVKYDLLIASYDKEKARIDALVAAYDIDKSAYEKDVNYWNGRGRIPKEEYNILEQKRIDLNNQVTVINQAKNSLNGIVGLIDSTEVVLNKLIITLNLHVGAYNNTIGSSTSNEFNEGEYVRDANGTAIHIFQFDNTNQLVRVLAHELGHALGLEHLDNPKAIMYYLNESMNSKLTVDDLAALKNVCGVE
ncbi:MAG: matrixin family metalloprotease [bacterium]|nr:matrixin family metalloprotease [bacterium]